MSQASMDPIARLGEYWLRAEIMHDFLHAMREAYDGDLGKLRTDRRVLELEVVEVLGERQLGDGELGT